MLDRFCAFWEIHQGNNYFHISPLKYTFLLRATGCPYIHPMHFRFLCNLKKKHCWGEPNLYTSSLYKLFQSYKGYGPMLIYSLFPCYGFLPSTGIPFLQCFSSQYEKRLLIFIHFLKKDSLCMLLRGLVYIFNTLDLDMVGEVICWNGKLWIASPVERMGSFSVGVKENVYNFLFCGNWRQNVLKHIFMNYK